MPTENTKTPAVAPVATPDPRDAELAALKQELAELNEDRDEIDGQNESLTKQVAELQEKLAKATKTKGAAPTPTGDYAVIKGKTYVVDGTVSARFATDEGRKGHLPDGLETELAILKG